MLARDACEGDIVLYGDYFATVKSCNLKTKENRKGCECKVELVLIFNQNKQPIVALLDLETKIRSPLDRHDIPLFEQVSATEWRKFKVGQTYLSKKVNRGRGRAPRRA